MTRSVRPRLCILTQYFPPEMGAPQARLSELGERLVDRGWHVDALTALPNYPTGRVFDSYDPTVPVVEEVGRLQTARVPLYTAKTGFAKRLASYYSFTINARRYGPRLLPRPDVIWAESPPLFLGHAAVSLSYKWRCPFVFNVSDLWPESAVRMGILRQGPLTKAAELLELSFYKEAAAVTAQSSGSVRSIVERCPGVRAEVITNGVEPARFGPDKVDDDARTLLGREPGPVFVYAGLLGWAQGLDQILDVAAAWPDDVPGRFVLIGEGPDREKLGRRIAEERIGRVRLLPAQPRHRIPALLAAADVAFITLGMSIPGAVPSKIYEAMAASLPIVLVADGEPAERVTSSSGGIAVAPGRTREILEACLRLAGDGQLRVEMGAAGRRAAETLYARDKIADRLDSLLREVAQG